ncbi:acyl-coenzyme A thioesterase 1-like [Salvelinus fontinalis]|uniref:acyl-coenzyme A thioesterase 1-like n=1 Tax=Salvelinus fontinalis TaxID=8038 RepID=UPI002485E2F0|nr:acyl-coenzyme A thioesterase 1-like [Salvelinus fontinalis]XP_055731840.1 acyl-coenzyme A thioesterase 1-like [Salvelinus fontinalis]XP_055731841.1 acyl-coenzyme A thioesterase 1-like [Salvelinus fontinalis]
MSKVCLQILPNAKCLFDEPVQLKVDRLKPRQQVDLRAEVTDDKGIVFRSSATYEANSSGTIDLTTASSLGGSYTGVEPMGLLWSLKPNTLHTKFVKKVVSAPCLVNFSVHSKDSPGILAEVINERSLLAEGVRRIPVNEGKIRGVLFVPPEMGPHPAVLDLHTFGRGLSETRASLLANRGFVVFTVSLYGHEDNPKNVTKIHLEYFEEAIQFLKNQPQVCGSGVGLLSLSKSGDLALSIATFVPGIAATVWINGCNANAMIPLHNKGTVIPPLMIDTKRVFGTKSGALNVKDVINDPMAVENQATLIPIERANGWFLFVAAEGDQNWDSCYFADQAMQQLKRHGKDNYESVFYPGAGHYLETPYMPFCPSSIHGVIGKPVVWGGVPRSHAAAEVDLWRRIQEFFRTNLANDSNLSKAKL